MRQASRCIFRNWTVQPTSDPLTINYAIPKPESAPLYSMRSARETGAGPAIRICACFPIVPT